MDYCAKLNERMLAIKDVKSGKVRLKYMTSMPVNFNEVGLLVLNLCDEGKSVDEIVAVILERCDMPESESERVKADVLAMLDTMWKSGIIKWKDGEFPKKEQYEFKGEDYVLRECTIEDSESLNDVLDTFSLDAFVTFNGNQTELIEAAMLITNVRFYEYVGKGGRVIIQTNYEKQLNQQNIQGVSFAGGEINPEAFEKVIDWEIHRNIENNMYVKNHFKSIPVYMYAATEEVGEVAKKLGFEKKGTLRKEVKSGDVDFWIKYVQV